MKVLSLFDGMSCGRIALERAGIKVNKYYASEVDKYAIKVSNANYPDIIQLGDVTKWREWDIEQPDIIIGGSPCQGFSFAGKQLAFDDPRSKLFFEFVEILKNYNPKYFLLENVRMKKEYLDVISDMLGVQPIMINSALVSAQNRVRYYWTNIGCVDQPEDKKIYLKDVLETGVVDRCKNFCIDANYFKGGNLKQYFEKHRRQLVFDKPNRIGVIGKGSQGQRIYSHECKSISLSALGGGMGAKTGLYHVPVSVSERGRKLTEDGTKRDDKNGIVVRGFEVRPDGKTCCLTTVQKDNYVVEDFVVRKLTPIECERLQTVPDNYTNHVSNTQRYKMIGNGWTVDVIAHIFKGLV